MQALSLISVGTFVSSVCIFVLFCVVLHRYRSGNQFDCGGLTFRTPCGAVGHGEYRLLHPALTCSLTH